MLDWPEQSHTCTTTPQSGDPEPLPHLAQRHVPQPRLLPPVIPDQEAVARPRPVAGVEGARPDPVLPHGTQGPGGLLLPLPGQRHAHLHTNTVVSTTTMYLQSCRRTFAKLYSA